MRLVRALCALSFLILSGCANQPGIISLGDRLSGKWQGEITCNSGSEPFVTTLQLEFEQSRTPYKHAGWFVVHQRSLQGEIIGMTSFEVTAETVIGGELEILNLKEIGHIGLGFFDSPALMKGGFMGNDQIKLGACGSTSTLSRVPKSTNFMITPS